MSEECGASVALEKPAGDPQWSSEVIGFSTERKLVASGKIPGIQLCLSFSSNQVGYVFVVVFSFPQKLVV